MSCCNYNYFMLLSFVITFCVFPIFFSCNCQHDIMLLFSLLHIWSPNKTPHLIKKLPRDDTLPFHAPPSSPLQHFIHWRHVRLFRAEEGSLLKTLSNILSLQLINDAPAASTPIRWGPGKWCNGDAIKSSRVKYSKSPRTNEKWGKWRWPK